MWHIPTIDEGGVLTKEERDLALSEIALRGTDPGADTKATCSVCGGATLITDWTPPASAVCPLCIWAKHLTGNWPRTPEEQEAAVAAIGAHWRDQFDRDEEFFAHEDDAEAEHFGYASVEEMHRARAERWQGSDTNDFEEHRRRELEAEGAYIAPETKQEEVA